MEFIIYFACMLCGLALLFVAVSAFILLIAAGFSRRG